MVLVNILLYMLTLWGCSSENQMVAYYEKYTSEMDSLKSLSKSFIDKYNFKSMSIRAQSKDIGIRLLVLTDDPHKGTGGYYNHETFELMPFSENTSVCDSCTIEERKKYEALRTDSTLKDILRLYTKIKPDAIKITSEGVFFALGSPLKHPNKSEVEGGILMPFGEDFNRNLVVKKIDENAYLYDTVVQ